MDRVKSDELKIMLATHFTMSADSVPTSNDLRMKSREYLLIKPRAQNSHNNYGNYCGMNNCTSSDWYKHHDDMEKKEVMR